MALATTRRVLERALSTQRTPGTPLFAASVTDAHGRLAVHPLFPLPQVIDITIGAGGLRESRALVRAARRRLRSRREMVLRARLQTIDSVGTSRTIPLLFRVRR